MLSVNVCVCSVLLDEFTTWFYIIAHQHGENLISLRCVLNGYLLEQSGRRVHGRFPKLFWVHLAQTFVSLGMDVLVFLPFTIFVQGKLGVVALYSNIRSLCS